MEKKILAATYGGRWRDCMNSPMTKGSFEYIKRRKRRQLLLSILMFSIALGIFLLGLFLNKMSKANVFTVFAVLMVLPSAKTLVSYIILIPFHSVSRKKYDAVIAAVQDGVTVWTDVVFTSPEKVMNLDFIIIDHNYIICYTEHKDKRKMMESYLRDGITKRDYHYQVESFDDFDRFTKRIGKLSLEEAQKDENYKETVKYLQSLMV